MQTENKPAVFGPRRGEAMADAPDIAAGRLGAAAYAANFGGVCSRVCPTEVLCEQACVRNLSEEKPVDIGALQRYATDHLFASKAQPFARAAASGKRVAVVGGGPAGLACAHRLAMLGHAVSVFEAREGDRKSVV